MPEYTVDQIREAWDHVHHEDEPVTELEGVLSEVYRTVGEDTETVQATLAFMFEKEPEPYTATTLRAYAKRFEVSYKDHKELADQTLTDLIGAEIERFLTYIDLDRLGADLADDDQAHYFEYEGRIYYFGSPA
jgi:hypothetical protein